jgi:hypothetical protein
MNAPTPRTDRRNVDGEGGHGDMLGGLTTGAGGQLGLPGDPPADEDRVMTIPLVPKEPVIEGVEVEPAAGSSSETETMSERA